jgi:phenylacetate-coenzyme A ligase PaaK-like adenylate-forming protein
MSAIIREERYILYVGLKEHVLRVQQLISSSESWPEGFRVLIPASVDMQATSVYGSTAKEVAERAFAYLAFTSGASTWLNGSKPC